MIEFATTAPKNALPQCETAGMKLLGGGFMRSGVFLVICISALIVTGARLAAPFEVAKDQATQLEGALRLTHGLGVTSTVTYASPSSDIMEPPRPNIITRWPPGFSVLVAGLLAVGLPLLPSLKLLFAVTTLAGWLGWGYLAAGVMQGSLRLRWLSLTFAALAPIFLTPSWKGTEIFLWAAIAWFVICLARSNPSTYVPAVVAGLIAGWSVTMRYAGAFLLLSGVLTLLHMYWPNIKSMLRQMAAFGFASLLFLTPLAYHLQKASSENLIPNAWLSDEARGLEVPEASSRNRVTQMIQTSVVLSNLVFGTPVVQQIAYSTRGSVIVSARHAVGFFCFVVILSLPWIVSRLGREDSFHRRRLVVLSYLPISLMIFLAIVTVVTQSPLFGVRRYYEPAAFVCVLIFFALAARENSLKWMKAGSLAIVSFFMIYLVAYFPLMGFFPERRAVLTLAVLGYMPSNQVRYDSTSEQIGYPSYRLYTKSEGTRRRVAELQKQFPEALFFINELPLFTYEGSTDGRPASANLRDLAPADFWKEAYTSKAIKVFWVCESPKVLKFLSGTNAKVIYTDTVEKMVIVESDFPEGYRFSTSS